MKGTSVLLLRPRRTRKLAVLLAPLLVAAPLVLPAVPASAAVTAPSLKWERTSASGFQESSPLVTSLAGDPVVVAGDIGGSLWAYRTGDGSDFSGYPRQMGHGIDSSPSSADIDGGGNQTIFIGSGTPATRGGMLFAMDDKGMRWSFKPSDNDFPELSMFSSPALGDVNGDGRADVSAFSLGLLGWSFSVDGAMNKGWPFYQDDTVFSSPAIADVNDDGVPEYIVGGDSTAGGPVDHQGGFIRALKGDGTELWAYPVNEMVRSSPAVGDIDGDGQIEIAAGTGDYWVRNGGASDSTKLFVLNKNGTLKWQKDLGAYTPASPVLADVNGDGKRDVVIGTWEGGNPGKVWAFDGNGNVLPNWNGRDSGGGVILGQISTADVNADGKQDLFVPTGAGVFVYDGATAAKLFALKEGLVSFQNAPHISDIDGNGRLDVVIAGQRPDKTGVVSRYEFGDSVPTLGALGWSQFRKDNRLTGSVVPTTLQKSHCTNGPGEGYWMAASDGGVFGFCGAGFHGSMGGQKLNAPVVGLEAAPDSKGYWEVGADGAIYAFGSAPFYGSAGGLQLAKPVVGMTRTPTGKGYWLVASDGGIFAYGDAKFLGSMGGKPLNKPIVGMASTPTGNGYWLVASDGGVFAYGDAPFYGSMGGKTLNQPIVGMTRTNDGAGYWFVASDGGIFAYGNAQFHGSTGSIKLNSPVVGMDSNAAGNGYRLVASDGGVFAYNSSFLGSTGAIKLNQPIIAMATAG
jgi:hypothetical protein